MASPPPPSEPSARQRLEHLPRLAEVDRVEAFPELTVDAAQEIAGRPRTPATLPEPGKARDRAELERPGSLGSRDLDRLAERGLGAGGRTRRRMT